MEKKILFLIIGVIVLILILGVIFLLSKNVVNNPSNFMVQNVKVEILKRGNGSIASVGDTVKVNYTGTLIDGKKFDSSFDRNQPFLFTLGENRVIQGWELGVVGMKVGEKRKLTIPPELGYGAQAIGEIIPANSTLVFEIDLLEVIKK
jgi:FKBP-type peptidyl-prolyl cis-trans isomerase FkpA